MKFVFGNYKMNGTLAQIDNYVDSINELPPEIISKVCVFFPFPFFGFLGKCNFKYGAQDCGPQDFGPFTGDTSPSLLKECNCSYVLLGHSERRKNYHETNNLIYDKIRAATQNNLRPVLCVGENATQRSNKFETLRGQLSVLTPKYDAPNTDDLIIAYEPIWAIGTGVIPTPEEISSTTEFISETAIKLTNSKPFVVYGGSVTQTNAAQILSIKNLDGVLVGGASLSTVQFKLIATIANDF